MCEQHTRKDKKGFECHLLPSSWNRLQGFMTREKIHKPLLHRRPYRDCQFLRRRYQARNFFSCAYIGAFFSSMGRRLPVTNWPLRPDEKEEEKRK